MFTYESKVMVVHGVGLAKFVIEPEGDEFLITQLDLDEDGGVWNVTPTSSYRKADNAVYAVKWLEANGDFPQRHTVSTRKTRRGDWMVFQALSATMGIGVAKVGSPAPGYKTGHQYGRFDTQAEAEAAALSIAEEHDGVVVAWEYPGQNTPFSALPRKYPTQTNYDTTDEAAADGWHYIFPDKTIEWYKGHLIYVQDITPGKAIDYELAIMVKGHDRMFARNELVWIDGKFSWRFRTGDVLDAIAAAHRFIDSLTTE